MEESYPAIKAKAKAKNAEIYWGEDEIGIKNVYHKVILTLDNLRVHHCKPVKEWLGKNKAKIEVFYLSPYSPELNPDEYLNNDLKNAVHENKGVISRANDTIRKKTISHLRYLQKNYIKKL